jgi:hypothetical protein
MIDPALACGHPAPERGGEFGGHTGGVWEVMKRHLPWLQPSIYRRFRRLTGGGEVFVEFYTDLRMNRKSTKSSYPCF